LTHGVLTLAYVLHIGGGTVGLVSGTAAAFAQKGERLHRIAGTIFFVSMLFMATFATYLAVVVPGQIANLYGGILAFYLVVTAWMTVRRRQGTIGLPEKIALVAILCLCVPFVLLMVSAATGGAPEIKGPFLIAGYSVGVLTAIAAIGDVRLVLAGGIAGSRRIARHLWRMLAALTFAFGSGFTNGLPRLLPGPMHVPPAFFAPMLLPLGLLVFWMIRVRLTGWFRPEGGSLAPLDEFKNVSIW